MNVGEAVAWVAGRTVGAAPLVIGTATTDADGRFGMTFSPTPATGQAVYVVARGGDPGSGPKAAIRLMTIAGIQGSAPGAGSRHGERQRIDHGCGDIRSRVPSRLQDRIRRFPRRGFRQFVRSSFSGRRPVTGPAQQSCVFNFEQCPV